MMLYDVGKVFHSTLELGELAPLIVARVQQIVEAEAAAIWLLDNVKKNLYCAAAAGPRDPRMDSTQVWASDPGLGAALSEGQPVLLHKIDDPPWTSRWGQPLRSILVVPLKFDGRFLGTFEAIRGVDGWPFTDWSSGT
jgi:GAF domain-containing protein